MDAILSSLLDLAGVNAVVIMTSGQVVAQQTRAIYGHDLGERIGHTVVFYRASKDKRRIVLPRG